MIFVQSDKLNQELISNLKSRKIIKSERVAQAMISVDRYYYSKNYPYADSPQTIGCGATISAPHMHASVLELLDEKLLPGERALDVGSGSGYLTACLATMIGPEGIAVGIEHISELVKLSTENVLAGNPNLIEAERVVFVLGDGRKGVPEYAPYNAIHVGAASPGIPEALLEQLKDGGRMVIPLGSNPNVQELVQIDKLIDGSIRRKHISSVSFVPLTSHKKQLNTSGN